MGRRGLCFWLAVFLFCSGCGLGDVPGGGASGEAWEVSVREFPREGEGVICLEVRNGKALFLDLRQAQADAPGGRNTIEVDLSTGEERELGFWSTCVQWDGEDYYWVGMTGPVVRSSAGSSFGMSGGGEVLTWLEWTQEGIWRGNGKGEGELLYSFPGGEREISLLELRDGWLSWVETPGETEPEEFCLMDLETGELTRREAAGRYWVDNGVLLSLDRRNILRAEDLSTGEEFFDRWDEGISRAFYDNGRILWNSGARAFHLYDCATGETQDFTDPEAGEKEIAMEPELLGGRFLVYRVVEPVLEDSPELHRGLRIFDLEKGEVLYRSTEDPRLEKRENWYWSRLEADREAGLLLLAGTEHEAVDYWSLTETGALAVFLLSPGQPQS